MERDLAGGVLFAGQPALENQSGGSAQAGNFAFVAGSNEGRIAGQGQVPGFPFDHWPEAMPGGSDFAGNENGAGGKRGDDHAQAASDPLRLAGERLLGRRVVVLGQVEEFRKLCTGWEKCKAELNNVSVQHVKK